MSETKIQDAEVVNESQALTVRHSQAVGQALGVDEIIAQVTLIQKVMQAVMKDGEHYGTIPGCGDKKTLLQPGAQKLTMTFRLCPEYEIQEVNIERGHKEYRVICTLKSMGSGAFVGQGVGCCSTMESKYRWRGGTRKCPKCGKETIIMGKQFKPTDPPPGWLCWTKKGGCGATWPKGSAEIESQSMEKQENENPADCYNTVLKMAKKRAFVDATITATAASDIFTQDIGDDEGDAPEASPPAQRPQSAPHAAAPPASAPAPTRAPAPASAPAPAAPKAATEKTREWFLANVGNLEYALQFCIDLAWLMPNEKLADLPLRFVPVNKEQLQAFKAHMNRWVEDGRAEPPYAPGPIEAAPASAPAAAETKKPKDDEWWREIVVVVPRKGMRRDEYLKAPDTIGSLFEMRHGTDDESAAARTRLWGFITHYEPKPWVGKDGKERPPNKSDVEFREALDAFKDWHDKNHPGERL